MNKMLSASFSPTHNKPQCFVCQKKLSLVEQTTGTCKCKLVFCRKHRCVRDKSTTSAAANPVPNTREAPCHTCSFDYVLEKQQLLREQNPHIKIDKVSLI